MKQTNTNKIENQQCYTKLVNKTPHLNDNHRKKRKKKCMYVRTTFSFLNKKRKIHISDLNKKKIQNIV